MKRKKDFIEYIENLIEYYSGKPKTKLICQYINQLKQLLKFLTQTTEQEVLYEK